MAAIEDVREVADAVASMFRNAYDRWRDLSGATRTERSELLWDSHLAQNFKNRSIAETVYIPVPRFQQLLWTVIDGRHASSNRCDKPLPAMEKINESPPVHNSILTPRPGGNLGTDVSPVFANYNLGYVPSVPRFHSGIN